METPEITQNIIESQLFREFQIFLLWTETYI